MFGDIGFAIQEEVNFDEVSLKIKEETEKKITKRNVYAKRRLQPLTQSRSSKNSKISYDVLAARFHLPLIDVCREFNVCLTFLKQLCRKHGIKRWPFRQVKAILKRQERAQGKSNGPLPCGGVGVPNPTTSHQTSSGDCSASSHENGTPSPDKVLLEEIQDLFELEDDLFDEFDYQQDDDGDHDIKDEDKDKKVEASTALVKEEPHDRAELSSMEAFEFLEMPLQDIQMKKAAKVAEPEDSNVQVSQVKETAFNVEHTENDALRALILRQQPPIQPRPMKSRAFPSRGQCHVGHTVMIAKQGSAIDLFPNTPMHMGVYKIDFICEDISTEIKDYVWESPKVLRLLTPNFCALKSTVHMPHTTVCVIKVQEMAVGVDPPLEFEFTYDHFPLLDCFSMIHCLTAVIKQVAIMQAPRSNLMVRPIGFTNPGVERLEGYTKMRTIAALIINHAACSTKDIFQKIKANVNGLQHWCALAARQGAELASVFLEGLIEATLTTSVNPERFPTAIASDSMDSVVVAVSCLADKIGFVPLVWSMGNEAIAHQRTFQAPIAATGSALF